MTPEEAALHVQKASEYIKSGDFVAAVEEARAAVQIDPANVEAHTVLGIALSRSGRWTEAESALRQALALRPDGMSHYNLASHLFTAGQHDAAAEHGRSALQYDPNHEAAAALVRNVEYQKSLQQTPAHQGQYQYVHAHGHAQPQGPAPFAFVRNLGWAWVIVGVFMIIAQMVTRVFLMVRAVPLSEALETATEPEQMALFNEYLSQNAGLLVGYFVWFVAIAVWWILDHVHHRNPKLLAFTIIGLVDVALIGCCSYGLLTLGMLIPYLILSRKKPAYPYHG